MAQGLSLPREASGGQAQEQLACAGGGDRACCWARRGAHSRHTLWPRVQRPVWSHLGGGTGMISSHTAFPSSALRSFWSDSKMEQGFHGSRTQPLQRQGAHIPQCLICYHPPLYAGCPRRCGDGQKSWLQNTYSGERWAGEEELGRGRGLWGSGRSPFWPQHQGLVLPVASSCHQLIMSGSEVSS